LGELYSTPPYSLSRLRALLLKGRGGKEVKGGGEGREREGRGDEVVSPLFGTKLCPCLTQMNNFHYFYTNKASSATGNKHRARTCLV